MKFRRNVPLPRQYIIRTQLMNSTVLRAVAWLILLITAAPCIGIAERVSVEQVILEAGNSDDDAVRLQALKRLQSMPDLDVTLDLEVDRL